MDKVIIHPLGFRFLYSPWTLSVIKCTASIDGSWVEIAILDSEDDFTVFVDEVALLPADLLPDMMSAVADQDWERARGLVGQAAHRARTLPRTAHQRS